MIHINSIEPLFCMCGSIVRKCSYCNKEFEEGPHPRDSDGIVAIKNGLIKSEVIKCIFCGNPTMTKDRIHRGSKEATKLFHERT